MQRILVMCALLGGLTLAQLCACDSASATVVVPVDDGDLVADAAWIVAGRVTAIESFWDAAKRGIFTAVTIAIDEVLKGDISAPEITLKQVGGTVGDVHSWVEGSPEFTRGEHVLVFLSANADGTPRIAHLHQGKFSISTDSDTGHEWAYRDTNPAGVLVLPGPVARHQRPPA